MKMKPTQGVPRTRRLQHHILRKCSKYLNASQSLMPPPPRSLASSVRTNVATTAPAVARTTSRPPTQPTSHLEPLPTLPSSQPPSSLSPSPLPPSSAPNKPIPRKCKKKIGTCSHEVVFGQHYDKKEWKLYAEKVRCAKSGTVIDPDYVAYKCFEYLIFI